MASQITTEWPRPRTGVDLANTGLILGDLADSKMSDLDLTFKIVTSRDLAPPFQGPMSDSDEDRPFVHIQDYNTAWDATI